MDLGVGQATCWSSCQHEIVLYLLEVTTWPGYTGCPSFIFGNFEIDASLVLVFFFITFIERRHSKPETKPILDLPFVNDPHTSK